MGAVICSRKLETKAHSWSQLEGLFPELLPVRSSIQGRKSGVVKLPSRPADVYGVLFIEQGSSRRAGWDTMSNEKCLLAGKGD